MQIVLVLLFAFMLSGCDELVVTRSERVGMEVISVDLRSKRNSKVDLKVIGKPTVYRGQRLSCGKSRAKNVKIGSRWDVVVEDYKHGNRYGTRLVGVGGICDNSQ